MKGRVAKNVFFNWLGLFSTVATSFFLTPFILHRIGDVAFGLWTLMVSVTGYYSLFDLGIRNAIIRYVSRFAAKHQFDEMSGVVSTSIVSYSVIGMLVLALTVLGAWKLDFLLRMPTAWSGSAKILLLTFGIGTAVCMPLSVFGGILEGLQQFAWIGGVQALASVVRALLIVWALSSGYGLLAIGFISVGVNILSYLPYLVVSFRICPELRLRRAYVDPGKLRMLASFGIVTFWIGIANRLRFQTDSLVIGSFLSVELISIFAIGSKLVSYTTELVQAMAQVFTPMSSHFHAKGDMDSLRRILITGNRYASLIIFPLMAVLLLLGKSFIRIWVGPAYSSSYTVLAILLIPMSLYVAQATSTKVLYGMGRHHKLALVLAVEGGANLVLSIVLLHWYGIFGVALGTAIPLTLTSVCFLPVHLCRLLDIRIGHYLRQAHLYPLLLTLPTATVLWTLNRFYPAARYSTFVVEVLVAGLAYGLTLLVSHSYMQRKTIVAARTSPVLAPAYSSFEKHET